MKNRESIIRLAVKDYKERNKNNVLYTVHDALAYSLEEHDAGDISQDEWEELLYRVNEEAHKPKFVLWQWDKEVYKVLNQTINSYTMENIKFGTITTVDKKEVIEIKNM